MTFNPSILTHKRLIEKYGKKCFYCGYKLKGYWEIDHIIARSKNGSDHITNLVPACRPCNHAKSNKTRREWIGWLEDRLELRQKQVRKIRRIIKKLKTL